MRDLRDVRGNTAMTAHRVAIRPLGGERCVRGAADPAYVIVRRCSSSLRLSTLSRPDLDHFSSSFGMEVISSLITT